MSAKMYMFCQQSDGEELQFELERCASVMPYIQFSGALVETMIFADDEKRRTISSCSDLVVGLQPRTNKQGNGNKRPNREDAKMAMS